MRVLTIELALEAYLISEPGMSYHATLTELIGAYLKPGTVTQPWCSEPREIRIRAASEAPPDSRTSKVHLVNH